jgi:hypothetical protein
MLLTSFKEKEKCRNRKNIGIEMSYPFDPTSFKSIRMESCSHLDCRIGKAYDFIA